MVTAVVMAAGGGIGGKRYEEEMEGGVKLVGVNFLFAATDSRAMKINSTAKLIMTARCANERLPASGTLFIAVPGVRI